MTLGSHTVSRQKTFALAGSLGALKLFYKLLEFYLMYHVVICMKEYHGNFEARNPIVFKKGEVYQAENHGEEYRVWRNNSSFLKFSPERFKRYFQIFC